MKQTNKKLYQSVAAMVVIGVILCGVFAYRTILYCRKLNQEMKHYEKQ